VHAVQHVNLLLFEGDAMTYHVGYKFSTKDQDNDVYRTSCAQQFKGSWWYRNCHHSNLNGYYYNGVHESFADGVNWFPWKGYNYSLKYTEMKLKPVYQY